MNFHHFNSVEIFKFIQRIIFSIANISTPYGHNWSRFLLNWSGNCSLHSQIIGEYRLSPKTTKNDEVDGQRSVAELPTNARQGISYKIYDKPIAEGARKTCPLSGPILTTGSGDISNWKNDGLDIFENFDRVKMKKWIFIILTLSKFSNLSSASFFQLLISPLPVVRISPGFF